MAYASSRRDFDLGISVRTMVDAWGSCGVGVCKPEKIAMAYRSNYGLGETVIGPNGIPMEVNPGPVTGDANVCTNGFNPFGEACTDFTPITNDPALTAAALKALYGSSAPKTPAPVDLQGLLSKYSNLILIGGVGLLALMVLGPRGRR